MSTHALAVPGVSPSEGRLWPLFSPFLLAYCLTALSLLAFGYAWGEVGFDMLVVTMGWPHVFLGFIFYFNKVVKGQVPHRTYFWILLALTLLICFAHTLTPMTTFIYVYFVYHAFRDEIFIHRQRRTGFRFGGPIFDGVGLACLAGLLLIVGVDQLSWRHVVRSQEVSLQEITDGSSLLIEFEAVQHSSNKEFFFSLVIPESEGLSSLRTFGSREDVSAGELLISGKTWTVADLGFLPYYEGQPGPGNVSRETFPVALQVTGGHSVGQTFTAESDGLSGIAVPFEVDHPVGTDANLHFTLESAFQMQYPFVDESVVLLLLGVCTLLGLVQVPAGLFGRYPELRYFFPVLLLFAAAQFGLEMGRFYSVVTPLLFSFLVVFHYYSWYVVSFEKIESSSGGGPPPPPADANRLDHFLRRIGSRRGFTRAVIVLNLLSLGGVLAYHSLEQGAWLKYGFDLQYFLYFLVFHVTMSFAPKKKASQVLTAPDAASA